MSDKNDNSVPDNKNDRRRAVSSAKGAVSLVMLRHNLTAAEWAEVINESMRRMAILGRIERQNGEVTT